MGLKLFFITYPAAKELVLCLREHCSNVKMLLEPLMSRAKRNNDERKDYATSFFMSKSKCKKESNKYYRRKCVNFKCKDCKDITPANLICQTAQETVKASQFELTKVPFTKIN